MLGGPTFNFHNFMIIEMNFRFCNIPARILLAECAFLCMPKKVRERCERVAFIGGGELTGGAIWWASGAPGTHVTDGSHHNSNKLSFSEERWLLYAQPNVVYFTWQVAKEKQEKKNNMCVESITKEGIITAMHDAR
uniref:Uncharacterized protein n=1 Tax=Salix viminalis TaxID=40686 RepID=A0A6N2N4B9_SALVM